MENERRSIRELSRSTIAVVLAGGRGTRLQQLTASRCKPAVPFAGQFRIIDFTLSNCVNSGIRQIAILTQYKAHSLMRHVERGWSFSRPEFGEFIDLLPAQQLIETSWYLGTADAVHQNLELIRACNADYVLILAGDYIYKMDYGLLIAQHVQNNADLTVGCVEVPLAAASQFGLMRVDENGRIRQFAEKPADPRPFAFQGDFSLASMGIYLAQIDFLCELVARDAESATSTHDFGHDIIPSLIDDNHCLACSIADMGADGQRYWRDVGTVDAFWEANMELIGVTPKLNLYDSDWPIRTYQEQTPPAKFLFDDDDRRGMAVDSMVSNGCIVSGGLVRHSLLFNNVRVNSYSEVEDSVLLPGVEIGRNCRIRRAVIDSNCTIPADTIVGKSIKQDKTRFHVTPNGIVLISAEMLGQESSIV
ncbi:MAG: glucose-1-phosphate adenylyltransferase [Pseudomonadales bacterium]|jgi:glucose-1-phosphate adenylyltransferase|nr:glucose-1-phosphate adenylyltransferase [Pseudomonadales bacterium]|tara:strand:- start:2406 stop:3665 length:1260 start_codon:yes stop_codon:yes gene_type:complete